MMIYDAIKMAQKAYLDNAGLTDMTYGVVTSASPLRIRVGDKLVIEAESLLLTNAVRNHRITCTVNIPATTWDTTTQALGGVTQLVAGHQHLYSMSAHGHSLNAGARACTIDVANALTVNDTVVMMRVAAGQKFIVLDRVEAAT